MPDASPSHPSPRDGVALRLHAVAIHLLRSVRREDAAAGLPPAQLSALSVLVFGGARSLGGLAAAEQVSPPTMSRIAAALEARGLLERRSDPADGRVAILRPTASGRRVLEEGRARRVRHLASLLEPLAPDEVRALERAVAALERVLGRP